MLSASLDVVVPKLPKLPCRPQAHGLRRSRGRAQAAVTRLLNGPIGEVEGEAVEGGALEGCGGAECAEGFMIIG